MSETTLEPVKYLVRGARAMAGREIEHDAVYIEERRQRDGAQLWVIANQWRDVFNRDGEWEWEPQPSSREDDFIARTRYASPTEALAVFNSFRRPSHD